MLDHTSGPGLRGFGPFILDAAAFTLRRLDDAAGTRNVALPPKAFDILELLTRSPGILLSPRDILKAIWPQAHVQTDVVKGHMLVIRAALDDRHGEPAYIESVRGRGYRFIAPVRQVAAASPDALLVGRARELGALGSSIDGGMAGGFRIMFVSGEPGIGKTALVTEAARAATERHPHLAVAIGSCIEAADRAEAFHPILEALVDLGRGHHRARLVEALLDVAPTWLVALPDLAPAEARDDLRIRTSGATRGRALREGVALIERITRDVPLLLILEDLHWVDEATADMLATLHRRRSPHPLTLIVTFRMGDARAAGSPLLDLRAGAVSDPSCSDVEIDPIDGGAAEIYLRQRAAPREVGPGLAAAIHRRAGGNPLFMGVLLDHLLAGGGVPQPAEGRSPPEPRRDFAPPDLPASLSQALDLRVRRLDTLAQRVLELGSLSPQGFAALLHGAVEGLPEEAFEEVCDELVSHTELIVRGEVVALPGGGRMQTYRFRHALYREAFLGRQGMSRLSRRHRALAERIAAVFQAAILPVAATVALHYESGDEPMRAAWYFSLAAEHATKLFAHGQAAAHLESGLSLLPASASGPVLDLRLHLLEKLALLHAGTYNRRAEATFDALIALAAETRRADAEARALIGRVFAQSWTSAAACMATITRALEASRLEERGLDRASTWMSASAWRLWIAGWNDADATAAEQALALIEAQGPSPLVAYHRMEWAMVLHMSGQYREAHDVVVQAHRILIAAADPPARCNLALSSLILHLGVPWTLAFAGDLGQAYTEFERRMAQSRLNGDHYAGRTLQLYMSWVQVLAGDYESAVATLGQAFLAGDQVRRDTLPAERHISQVLLGRIALGRGRIDDAIAALQAAQRLFDAEAVILDWYWTLVLRQGLISAWAAAGDLDRAEAAALRHLEAAEATRERTLQALAWTQAAALAHRRGSPAEMHARLDRALALVATHDLPLARWRVHRAAAVLLDAGAGPHAVRAWRDDVGALAATLPADHPSRIALLSQLEADPADVVALI